MRKGDRVVDHYLDQEGTVASVSGHGVEVKLDDGSTHTAPSDMLTRIVPVEEQNYDRGFDEGYEEGYDDAVSRLYASHKTWEEGYTAGYDSGYLNALCRLFGTERGGELYDEYKTARLDGLASDRDTVDKVREPCCGTLIALVDERHAEQESDDYI